MVLLAGVVASVGFVLSDFSRNEEVLADDLCVSAKCKEAEAKEAEAYQKIDEASQKKNSFKAEVARYKAEVSALQAQINVEEEEVAELNVRIDNTEKKIKRLKESLKNTLVKLYLANDVSEFEILASADSVSDFTNKSVNQGVIQGKIKQLTAESKEAKEELDKERTQLETKVENNKARRSELAKKQKEQEDLVKKWSGKEAEFSELAQKNADIKNAEREAQRQANLARQEQYAARIVVDGGTSSGGYPYNCPAAWDSYVDAWGMYSCECVSYGAWKVASTYGNMPYWGGRGNAYQWIANSQAAGIPGGYQPKPGSIAVMGSGAYGHVAWVEQVAGDQIYISQYNYGVDGTYSEMWISAAAFDYFIYFGEW